MRKTTKILLTTLALTTLLLVGCEYEYESTSSEQGGKSRSDLVQECADIDYRIDVKNGAPASEFTKAQSIRDCNNGYYYIGEEWIINYIEENK